MVYKDMTFCPFWEKCKKGKDCRRALTKELVNEAERYGLPISRFMDKPEKF